MSVVAVVEARYEDRDSPRVNTTWTAQRHRNLSAGNGKNRAVNVECGHGVFRARASLRCFSPADVYQAANPGLSVGGMETRKRGCPAGSGVWLRRQM